MPVEWFSAFSKNENINKEATSLNDSILKVYTRKLKCYKVENTIPFLAPSELEKQDIFHPAYILNDKNAKLKPYLIGTGGSTDLIHAVNIGSQSHNLKGKN